MGCNEGRYCYVDGKEEHFPMNAAQVQYWAREIDKEGSDISQERPSSRLIGMLKTEKRTRQKTGKKEQQSTPATVLPPSLNAPTINYYIGRGSDEEIARQR